MIRKPIIPRGLAVRDVEDAIDHLLVEASATAAFGFIDALEQAYAHVAGHPASGSTRYELGLSNVRSWRIDGYRYLIFYVEQSDHIGVWRVLHAQRDIPA